MELHFLRDLVAILLPYGLASLRTDEKKRPLNSLKRIPPRKDFPGLTGLVEAADTLHHLSPAMRSRLRSLMLRNFCNVTPIDEDY
jgi:hypothetical protein